MKTILFRLKSNINQKYILNSLIDDSNFIDPAGCGYSGNYRALFTSKIIISNKTTRPILNARIIVNNNDYLSVKGIIKTITPDLRNKLDVLKKFYNFTKDNIAHSTNYLPENFDVLNIFNAFGYGICGNIAKAFSQLFETAGIPARLAPANGHAVNEYFANGKWQLIDFDANAFYLDLNNCNYMSYSDICRDPFGVLRTKCYGKYLKYDLTKSILSLSLFNRNVPELLKIKTADNTTPKIISYFDLFSGEKIIFHYDKYPRNCLGWKILNSYSKRGNIAKKALGVVEQRINLNARGLNTDILKINSVYPIIKIKIESSGKIYIREFGRTVGRNEVIKIEDRVIRSIELNKAVENPKFDGWLTIYSQCPKFAFPLLRKGINDIVLKSKSKLSAAEVKFAINQKKIFFRLPSVSVENKGNIFANGVVEFILKKHSNSITKIWWQISTNNEFNCIIPNFDNVQNFKNRIVLTELDKTFISNNSYYYFRVKAKSGDIWGDWSAVYSFKVKNKFKVENIVVERISKKKILLKWEYSPKLTKSLNPEFYIFGSNNIDFLPEIYSNLDIAKLKLTNGNILTVQKKLRNSNLIEITKSMRCELPDKFKYYRIIPRFDSIFGLPSGLVIIESNNQKPVRYNLNYKAYYFPKTNEFEDFYYISK